MDHDDFRLRELFTAQRAHDATTAASFERVVAAPHARSSRRSLPGLARPALAMIGVLALVLIVRFAPTRTPNAKSGSAAPPIDVTSRLWRAPTDFLLDVPGADLLRTVPTLGEPYPGLTPPVAAPPHDSNSARKGGPES